MAAHVSVGSISAARPLSVGESLAASGVAVVGATLVTHPVDVVKVRLQLAGNLANDAAGAKGCATTVCASSAKSVSARADAFSIGRFLRFWPALYAAEGGGAFFAGVRAAAFRGGSYGAVRLGLCEPLQAVTESRTVGALLAGVLATVLGNPLEVLKVRLQARPSEAARGEFSALRAMVREEGLPVLARGFHLAAARSALLTASQVVPYSHAKSWLQQTGLRDGPVLHVGASLAAGVVTCTATAPVDVMKTRVMSATTGRRSVGVLRLLQQDGPFAFFRGWLANYVRIGPQTLFIFLFYEQTRRIVEAIRV